MNVINTIRRGFLQSIQLIPAILKLLMSLPKLILILIRALCRRKWRCRKKKCVCRGEVHLPSSIHKRADPLLYDQYYLMGKGLAVTWDNPDIQLYKSGIPISSSDLEPNSKYEVRVRVWNNSYDAPAAGLPVHLSFLSFGVQTTSTYLGKTFIDLGVKGSSQCPAYASFEWVTPKEGHYCLQANLVWSDDANPFNNLGQENTNVGELHSPAHFTFKCRNIASVQRRFVFEVDDYQIPKLESCPSPESTKKRREEETLFQESKRHWKQALAKQAYGKFSNLPDWHIEITPHMTTIGAGEEIEVKVSIEPKFEGFQGQKPFNIHAFSLGSNGEKTLEGGVTLIVKK